MLGHRNAIRPSSGRSKSRREIRLLRRGKIQLGKLLMELRLEGGVYWMRIRAKEHPPKLCEGWYMEKQSVDSDWRDTQ